MVEIIISSHAEFLSFLTYKELNGFKLFGGFILVFNCQANMTILDTETIPGKDSSKLFSVVGH